MADSDIAVTSLVVTGGFGVLTAQWTCTSATTPLPYLQLDHFEVWVAGVNNRASATLIAEPKDLKHPVNGLGYSVTRYFWIRPIDRSNNAGDFYPLSATAGVGAATKSLITDTDILPNSLPGSVMLADSVTVRELRVTEFANLILNPTFEGASSAGWSMSAGISVGSGSADMPSANYLSFTPPVGSNITAVFVTNAACKAGDQFYVSYDYETSGNAPRDTTFTMIVRWYDNTGVLLSSGTDTIASVNNSTLATHAASFVAPAGAVMLKQFELRRTTAGTPAGGANASNFNVRRKNAGYMYVDGTIEGRHVAADTMSVDKLEIGARKFAFEGIRFEFNDPATNRASWTAGIIRYIDDANAPAAVSTSAGSTSTWSSGVIYIYWIKGDTALSTTTSSSTAFGTDRVVLATYRGGKNLAVTFGKFTIDGALDVKIDSLITDRIGANNVTNADAVFTAGTSTIASNVGAANTLQTLSFNASTGQTIVKGNCVVFSNEAGSATINFHIKKGGTTVRTITYEVSPGVSTPIWIPYIDNAPSNASWTLVGERAGATPGSIVFSNRYLECLNTKR